MKSEEGECGSRELDAEAFAQPGGRIPVRRYTISSIRAGFGPLGRKCVSGGEAVSNGGELAITAGRYALGLREVNVRSEFVVDTCGFNELIEDVRDMENSPNAVPTTQSASIHDASHTISRFSFAYSHPEYPARIYRISLAYDSQARIPRCRIEIRNAAASNGDQPFSAGLLTRESLRAAIAMLPLIEEITGRDTGLGTGSACLYSGSFMPVTSAAAMC